jgi:hypothetical protein
MYNKASSGDQPVNETVDDMLLDTPVVGYAHFAGTGPYWFVLFFHSPLYHQVFLALTPSMIVFLRQ